MSFFLKKNLYDKFKINSNKFIKRPLKNKELSSSSLTSNNSHGFLLSKILKGTKSVLKNKTKFSRYMNEYQAIVSKSTFKRPDIQNYPLLRKECRSMIPIKSLKIERGKRSKKIIKKIFNKENLFDTFKEKFKINLSSSMSLLDNRNKKYNIKLYNNLKQKEKLLLFSDFFYKWNKNKQYDSINNNYNNNLSNNFSPLSYDENKIFYQDYSEFIKERIENLKTNKLENLQKKLKINILDSQKKKIKLELISMKLIFEPINMDKMKYNKEYNFEDYQEICNSKNENSDDDDIDEKVIYKEKNNDNPKNIINFPLSYVFLFYVNGFDYFKDILLSSIKFSNNYQKISFKEDEIYMVLRKERDKKKFKTQRSSNPRLLEHKGSVKFIPKGSSLFKKNLSIKLNKISSFNLKEEIKKEQEKIVNFNINNIDKEPNNPNDVNNLYKTSKKIVTIHANPDLKNKEKFKNDDSNTKKKKEIKYTEYCFIWETPTKTYRVRMIMPIIIFWSEHIKKNIITYCDKDLFLFLLQNNFINWDYYILNYLFSIKIFRKIILSGLSLYSNYNLNDFDFPSFTERKKEHLSTLHKSNNNPLISYINETSIILNSNKKVYNQLNENNESYKFFYTDNFSINSIIDFHSYHIFIEYDKLNSKICWEFALNFKQMKYLTNINKYESLETFLPKIIHTNFEDGTLSMDFSVFEFFNSKIYEHQKNEEEENCKTSKSLININLNINNNENNFKKKIYSDMTLVIKMPFIIVEQYVKSRFLNNNVEKICLNSNFLNKLINCKNITWSKKFLKLINNRNGLAECSNKSSLNLAKGNSYNDDSKRFKYEKNERCDEYLNDYYKYKKFSKSLHCKRKKIISK